MSSSGDMAGIKDPEGKGTMPKMPAAWQCGVWAYSE